MSDYTGRYYSKRDMRFINSINNELLDNFIETVVVIFKVSPTDTKTNIYGETDQSSGKFYFPPVTITAYVDRGDIRTEPEKFGPDVKQTAAFKFIETALQTVNLYPQRGDLIAFNERYYEIDNVAQEQFQGGQPDKSLSIICNTHYTRFSKVDIIDRQV